LIISSDNSLNDPNPIINFAKDTFTTTTTTNFGSIIFNFSSTTVVRFEKNSLTTDSFSHQIHLTAITLVDLSLINSSLIKTNLHLYFIHVRYVKWFKVIEKTLKIQFHFDSISNGSCLIYQASRSIPWLFLNSNTTICNCPLLFAYKYGQLDGQIIPCIRAMSGYESARKMDECYFERKEKTCYSTVQSLTDLDNNTITSTII
jgi:hypothetical protein